MQALPLLGRRPVLPAVNGLRFAAVMHVVLIHTITTRWLPFPVYSAVRAGYTSTSALFILSGFILTWVYSGRDGRATTPRRPFLVGRLSRILPLLAVSQLLVLPLWLRTHSGAAAWVPFAVGLTGQQGWWPPLAMVLNTPAWAVGVFVAAYLLLPWLLDRFRGLSERGLAAAMAATWVASMLPGVLYHLSGNVTGPGLQLLYTFPAARLPEFVFGVLLGRWLITHGPVSARTAAWASTVGAAAWLGWISVASLFPIELIHNGLLAPAQGLLIVGLAHGGGLPARVMGWAPIRTMGERALSIFLLHLPILTWMQTLGAFPRTSPAVSAAAFLAYLTLTIGLSVLVADHFVNPISRWLRRRLNAPRPVAADPAPALPASLDAALPPVVVAGA